QMFRRGFLDAALPGAIRSVAAEPFEPGDTLFWQFPCRTESTAHTAHASLAEAPQTGSTIHVYLGLPWATWLDRRRVDPQLAQPQREALMQRVRIAGFRHALAQWKTDLRIHTVCQHVYWRDLLPMWKSIGITDVWLSHLPSDHPGEL